MISRVLASLSSALLLLGPASTAVAQPAPVPTVTPPRIGDCTIRVTIAAPPAKGWLKVDINMETVAQKRIDRDSSTVAVAIKGPILDGDRVRARVVVDGMPAGTWSETARAVAGTGVPECQGEVLSRDDRDAFEPSGYVGIAYDNFALPQFAGYKVVNPDAAGTSNTRFVAGTDMEGRILGKPGDKVQLWLSGETLYGVRSQDVDCANEPAKSGVCKNPVDPANTHYILAHATSMEFYVAPRLEFWTLQKETALPAKVYVSGRFGYLALADSAGKNVAMYHVGGGVLAPSGPYTGSYIEAGWGKTDNLSPTWNRFKLDGYFTFEAPGVLKFVTHRMFIQLYVDKSLSGESPDSIQTFMGAEYDIKKWFGK